jgi:putative endonuclease
VGRYHVTTLVYVEHTHDVRAAIAREKQIKGWTRAKKVALIDGANPSWRDLGLPSASEPRDPSLRSG